MTKHTGQLTLGELIDALKKRDQDHTVRFDFCGLVPTGIDSYRGYYEDLALSWGEWKYGQKEPMNVGSLVTLLEGAVGQTYTGYKGGDFKMDRDTAMWVANCGDSDGTCIVGVEGGDYNTVIKTAWEPL